MPTVEAFISTRGKVRFAHLPLAALHWSSNTELKKNRIKIADFSRTVGAWCMRSGPLS